MFNFNEMNLRGPNKKDVEETVKNLQLGKELKPLSLSEKKKMLVEAALKKDFQSQQHLDSTFLSSESEAKLEPNLSQSEAKLEPNLSQSEAKVRPNLSQSKAKLEPKNEKLGTQLEPKLRPNLSQNLGQSEAKLEPKIMPKNFMPEKKDAKHSNQKTDNIWKEFEARLKLKNPTTSFEYLTGLQKKIFVLFFLELSREKVTGLYRLNNMSKVVGGTENSIRKAIQRLEGNGFIERYEYKNGRGGATSYYLRENICNEIEKRYSRIQLQQMLCNNKNEEINIELNLGQSEAKLGTQLEPKLRPNCPSSSSFNINTKTTTTSEPDEWTTIRIPDVLRSHNFGEHIVKQIRDRSLLTPTELQDSLDAYAFDISENNLIQSKKISDPVRYFMSIANKKMQYAPPGNYKSDEMKALEENMARLEIIQKRREQMERVQKQLEFEIAEVAYLEWAQSLSIEAKIDLVPEDFVTKVNNSFHNQKLRHYYETRVRVNPSASEASTFSQNN